jgi:hypothetical protein
VSTADSAGVPWEGRHFEPNPSAGDDGSATPHLIEALERFRFSAESGSGEFGEAGVVDAVRTSRLLIPLIAHLGDHGVAESGLVVDKSQELSIVTVLGPDGRTVMPVFSSVETMARWNPNARPVPASGVRVAAAAASEGTDLVVLDPTSVTEFVIRRPALWSIANDEAWVPSYLDTEVLGEFMRGAALDAAVLAVQLAPGDPGANLSGAELEVHLTIADGLDRNALDALIARLQLAWSHSEVIAHRVDSMRIRFVAAR